MLLFCNFWGFFSPARAVAPTPRLLATYVGFDSDLRQAPKHVLPDPLARLTVTKFDAF
ncbi:hypothetical protein Hsero_0919 [Herbaspirillum seropedicae SmR1]|uniref:Uncharacterized protein n=1 Tax=Herbaspirillum seropedicae (strain SmR1) TaxID=757424 RepID=D8J099_HERSS|nr:hypothetical protein Hsero_0919 [Herbaspirillum seropedicae SmR1]